jgi:hypothetical protein
MRRGSANRRSSDYSPFNHLDSFESESHSNRLLGTTTGSIRRRHLSSGNNNNSNSNDNNNNGAEGEAPRMNQSTQNGPQKASDSWPNDQELGHFSASDELTNYPKAEARHFQPSSRF